MHLDTSSNVANNQHQHHTREAYNNKITIPQVKTTHYNLQSIKYKAAKDWDEMQKELTSIDFNDEYLSKTNFSNAFKQHFSDNDNCLNDKF